MPLTLDDESRYATSGQVQSVARAAALLESFADGESALALTDLARRTGLNVSTAHRLLRTLCSSGLLAFDERAERYSPGPVLLRLARSTFASSALPYALSVLHELVEQTGESASLGHRDGGDAVVVLSVASNAPLRFSRPAGSRVPLHVSAMGKALLAFGPTSIVDAVGALGPLPRVTSRSITSIRSLTRDLEATAARGYSIVDEEQHIGLRSIGAPIVDARGVALAAVAVQGPVARLTEARYDEVGQMVCQCATRLQGALDDLAIDPS